MVKSIKFYDNFNIRAHHRGSIILIGNFDGLHRGHQKLFNKAKNFKKKFKLKIGVITFDPIPKMFFKKLNNYRLSNFDQKIQLFTFFKFPISRFFLIKVDEIINFLLLRGDGLIIL